MVVEAARGGVIPNLLKEKPSDLQVITRVEAYRGAG